VLGRLAEDRLDLECGAARCRGVDAPAVVHDPFEDREGPDPHGGLTRWRCPPRP
jgi:hypothetical protein